MSVAEKEVKPKGGKTVSKFKRLTTSQQAEATALWRSGAVTLDDLAKRFDKSKETFSRLFKRLQIIKGQTAERHTERVEAKVEGIIVDEAGETAKKIKALKDEHLKMNSGITKLMWQKVVVANTEKRAISTEFNNIKTYEKILSALKTAREEGYMLLGIAGGEKDDETTLPSLLVKELTAADILEMQRIQQAALKEEADDEPGEVMLDDDGSLPSLD